MVPLCVHRKTSALFSRVTWQLEKTSRSALTAGQAVKLSSQTVAINCPLMKQLCFLGSRQMLSVRPCLPVAPLCSRFLIPNTAPHHILSTSLAEPCGRHSVAWNRAWKQILAGLCEPWDQSRPTHDLLAHSALLNSGLEELFRPFTEIEEEIPQ